LITAAALTFLLVACIAVAITWLSGDGSGTGVDLSTDDEAAVASSEPPSSETSGSDRWGTYGSGRGLSGVEPAGTVTLDGAAGGDDDAGATSPSNPSGESSVPSAPSGAANVGNSDAGGGDGSTSTTQSPSSTEAEQAITAASQTQPVSVTTTTTTTTTAAPARAKMAVFGVAYDDVLNLRTGPGSGNPVILGLGSVEESVAALGGSRTLSDATVWYEVEARGVTGWAAARYLLYRGPTNDVTSQVVGQAGEYPEAANMSDLGRAVANLLATSGSTIVLSGAPSTGDLGQVSYDVVGIGNSAVGGLRLRVYGTPSAGGGFSLRTVEATDYCLRGGSPSQGCT
jgi:uncharacterized protein YraI